MITMILLIMTLLMIILILILKNFKLKIDTSPTLPMDDNNVENNYNTKYVKRDYLLTASELKFYKLLKTITDELNLTICPQVPLYEIIRNKDFKDFNRIQAKSIDFVIAEPNLKIKMCIELDDHSHYQNKRVKRDEFVNKLFKDLDLKLIRIPVQSFYNLDDLRCKIKENL